MRNFYRVFSVILSSFVFAALAYGQPAAGSGQGSGNGGQERSRRQSVGVETYTDLNNKVYTAPSNVYELRCRGGGGLNFTTVGSKTHSSGAVMITLELSFSPSLEAAGANSGALYPSECSWVNRPVNREKEPWRVRFETPANAQLKQTQQGSEVDRSPTAAERFPDAITIPNYLKSQNHYWSFYVSDTDQGYFTANSHGHWKKMLEERMIPKDRILIRQF